eukprot:gene24002-biopygen19382
MRRWNPCHTDTPGARPAQGAQPAQAYSNLHAPLSPRTRQASRAAAGLLPPRGRACLPLGADGVSVATSAR